LFFSVSLPDIQATLPRPYHSGIADHVGGQNGGKLALHLPPPFDERLTKISGRVYVVTGTL
jgi:hypothetical protein